MNPIDASIREEIQLNKEPWSQSKPNKPYKLLKFVDTVSATSLGRYGGGVSLPGGVCIQVVLGRPPPPGIRKADGTYPTGMLSCFA